jgi:hemoglobin
MSETPANLAPFELIGGQPAVDRVVDAFYDRMSTLPDAAAIRAMHARNLGPMRMLLKKYLAQWLGGPQTYSEERGHPRLRARHLPFSIGVAERDQWMLCMRGAMEQEIADAALRGVILEQLAALADHMRNRAESD